MIGAGLAVLTVPAVYIVNKSNAIFREECRQLCDASGMDFKIRAVGPYAGGRLDYPGECQCVQRGEKQWWKFW